MQWYLLRYWVNEHAWSQSSLSAHCYGELLLRALLEFRTTRALLLVDFLSVSEVCPSSAQTPRARNSSDHYLLPRLAV